MSERWRSRGLNQAAGLAATEMAIVVVLVVALVAAGMLAPRLVRTLADHVTLCDRHAAAQQRLQEARAEADPGALAELAREAQAALADSTAAFPSATERGATLAGIDAAARAANIVLRWEPVETPQEGVQPPCVAHCYRLIARGEFGALLGFLAAVAEDLPATSSLDGLTVEADAATPETSLSTLRIQLMVYSVAETDDPAPLQPRAAQGALAGQE